jgi:anti-sigma B factor antagonist
MSLEFIQREREGIILLDLKGRIVAGPEITVFWSAIEGVSKIPKPKVILNLHEIDLIDSSGLGAMVMCQTQLRKIGGVARLAFLNKDNFHLLPLAKIDTVFEIFDDETEAVNSFFPGREIRRFDILEFVTQFKEGQAIESRKDK